MSKITNRYSEDWRICSSCNKKKDWKHFAERPDGRGIKGKYATCDPCVHKKEATKRREKGQPEAKRLRVTKKSQECLECHKLKRFSSYYKCKSSVTGFGKVCKPCSLAEHKKQLARRKKKDWLKWKASNLRASWMTRARKYENINRDTIPTTTEIRKWLKEQHPYKCYLTGRNLDRDKMEVDHKRPVSKGGSFTLDNVGLTDTNTNALKSDMLEEDFRSLLLCVAKWEDKGESLFSIMRRARFAWGR